MNKPKPDWVKHSRLSGGTKGNKFFRLRWSIHGRFGTRHMVGTSDQILKFYLGQMESLYARGFDPV